MLLENDLGEFSVLQAYPLQWITVSCSPTTLRRPDRKTTSVDQICSIECLIYVHWVVFPLEWPVSHITVPYVSGTVSSTFFSDTHAWPLFTRTGSDQVRLFLQLSVHFSCDRAEWCRLQTIWGDRIFLYASGSGSSRSMSVDGLCPLSMSYSIYLFCALGGGWGVRLCA